MAWVRNRPILRKKALAIGHGFEDGGFWQVPQIVPNFQKHRPQACKWLSNYVRHSWLFKKNLLAGVVVPTKNRSNVLFNFLFEFAMCQSKRLCKSCNAGKFSKCQGISSERGSGKWRISGCAHTSHAHSLPDVSCWHWMERKRVPIRPTQRKDK